MEHLGHERPFPRLDLPDHAPNLIAQTLRDGPRPPSSVGCA